MKKFTSLPFPSLLLAFLFAATLASCEKDETSSGIDGMWQVVHQRSHTPSDVRGEEIYWSLRAGLLQIETKQSELNGKSFLTMAHYQCGGGKLTVTDAYIHFREEDELVPDGATDLLPLGLQGGQTVFEVRELTSKRLILVSATDSLVLRGFNF